jgi:PAS domain S-box-containing protein
MRPPRADPGAANEDGQAAPTSLGLPLEAKFESAPHGEALLDATGRYERVNASFARLSGVPAASHPGRRPIEIASDFGACLDRAFQRGESSGFPVLGWEHAFLAKDGRMTHVVVNLDAVKEPSGVLLGYSVTVLDVTPIRQILARAAHELRTPLSSTLMWLHLLRAGGGRRHPGALAALEQSAQSQLQIIDELFRAADDGSGFAVEAVPRMRIEPPVPPKVLSNRANAKKRPLPASTRSAAPAPSVLGQPPRRPKRESAKMLSGLDVLVVEDDDLARDGLALVFEDYGARVTTAASVAEALDELGRAWPHVLISDISMPREDGYVLIRKVKELARSVGRELPAIALTGFTSHEAQARVLAAGFDAFVAKPVAAASLLAVVRGLCGRTP